MAPYPRPAHALTLILLLSVAAQAGCLLLLWLSTFGQNPFPELPVPMILMFGALLSGPLESLSRQLPARAMLIGLLGAVAANLLYLALANLLAEAATLYLLAPATALALTATFRILSGRYGEMLSAMTVYGVATVLANYTFDSFIPFGDFFLVNVGTFFFGITFTQRDRVHRFGRRSVYLMIAAAALANVLMSLHLGTPLRYVFVGFLAILLSESADTEIYARLLHRRWFTRVASSNAVSAPLDTLIFTILAFAGEEFATSAWMFQVIVTDVLVKYGSSLLAALQIVSARRPAVGAGGG
ncbi:MAG: VUT family protein [Trueperaceae bacterium]